ncbi:MAG TPA: glycosyltransferase family 2 protein [Ornithinimicrobium sp.]|uniref:glycosyltransferase family 2 protein n=1 Tax=Ornithinimicrobium sp. TaxID=1977084 RepID=UPI002B48E1DF|nr:glycosyltransferase family 2 protein [Ornithinimicrobium sp.]HKJ13061.1 glycosyltransferase family 2 protein [Ornithinimicrobium sp.]
MTVSPTSDDAVLVVPVFNEAAVIAEVVTAARAAFAVVVCVDDGSTDGSAALAQAAGATVVRHPFNLGQGAALQTGVRYVLDATPAAYLVTFDADGQHQVADAVAMARHARQHELAVVFGSRFLDDRTRPGGLRRLLLKSAVWLTNQQTGMRLSDAHNGLRVIRRDAAMRLDLRANRMAHATEIVLQLGRTRLPWQEYPVHVLYTDYSRAKGQSLMNAVNVLLDSILK